MAKVYQSAQAGGLLYQQEDVMEMWEWRDLSPTELFREVGSLRREQFDLLPFGAILLDPRGNVLQYNRTEADLSQREPEEVVGRNFFEEIAPCTNVRDFRGRFVEAVWKRELDATFDFTFRFAHGWRQVRIRLVTLADTRNVLVTVEPLRVIAKPGPAIRRFDELEHAISA